MTAHAHFHLSPDYVPRLTPDYYEDADPDTVWQPDVYRLLRDLARLRGCREIVDVGCGRAGKLVSLHPEFSIVGIDVGSNLEYCRGAYPWGRWIDANLEPARLASDLASQLSPTSGFSTTSNSSARAIVCADVIEHLVDPSGLLDSLERLLRTATFALVSTPERDLARGIGHNGPPPNPAHVREWNLRELRALLEGRGMTVAFAGLTASNSRTFEAKTGLVLAVRRDSAASDHHDLAASCQALLRTYAGERHWRGTGRPVTGAASPPEHAVGTTVLPGWTAERMAARTSTRDGSAPMVSIVPHFNGHGPAPSNALDAVFSQTWTDWELLVPESCTLPEHVCAALAAAPDRVRAFRPSAPNAASVTRDALALARGRYIATLDADVSWEPLFLASAIAHLESHPAESMQGAVAFQRQESPNSGAYPCRCGDGAVTTYSAAWLPPGPLAPAEPMAAPLAPEPHVPPSAMLYPRAALNVCGPYRAELGEHAAPEFSARVRRHIGLHVLPLVLVTNADWKARAFPCERETLMAERDAARAQAAQAAAARDALYTHLAERAATRLKRGKARAVVIVGAGEVGDISRRVLAKAGIEVRAVADNDRARWNQDWHGLSVQPVDEIAQVEADAILIASVAHAAPLARQVRSALRSRDTRRRVLSLAA